MYSMAKPRFACTTQNMYSFIVFKYVNLILWKEQYILNRENCLIFWGIWGEAELILGIWGGGGGKGKILLGSRGILSMDLGRSMHYF